MIVYVITQGEYSEYHICAVTTDRERAEHLRRLYMCRGISPEIEEYDTEEDQDTSLGRLIPIYEIFISKDGKLSAKIDHWHDSAVPFKNDFKLERSLYNFTAYISAKDEEHAKKIALDTRAKMLADVFGIT